MPPGHPVTPPGRTAGRPRSTVKVVRLLTNRLPLFRVATTTSSIVPGLAVRSTRSTTTKWRDACAARLPVDQHALPRRNTTSGVDTKVASFGAGTHATTLLAAALPLLAMTTVTRTTSPGRTVFVGELTPTTSLGVPAGRAFRLTWITQVDGLFAGTESVVVEPTSARTT